MRYDGRVSDTTGAEGEQGAVEFRHIITLVLFQLFFCVVASFFYPEPFIPGHHAVSDFGATVTHDSLEPNPISPWIYGIGLALSAVWVLMMPSRVDRDYRHRNTLRHLCVMCAVAFLMMIAPHDLPSTRVFHVTGSGFLFFALWAMTMLYLFRCRSRGHLGLFRIGMVLLQVTILSYAVLFVVDSPAKQMGQAVSIIGLLLPLLAASYIATHDDLVREVEPVS